MLAEEILSRLEILPLDGLRIHEQTIPENVRALRETMLNLGRIVDPIIIDKKHQVVLDGNHRREVLAAMQCENAICQVVDYDDEGIAIGAWYPASPALTPKGLGGEKVDRAAGEKALERMEACFMLVKGQGKAQECRLFASPERKLGAVMGEQERLLKQWMAQTSGAPASDGGRAGGPRAGGASPMEGKGYGLQYVEDSRAERFLAQDYGVLMRRPFTKKEVVAEALAGRPLPPKSTRHHIPDRIIRLNFHLGYLNETPERARMLLEQMVKKRVQHGSARYYTEPVIVMY